MPTNFLGVLGVTVLLAIGCGGSIDAMESRLGGAVNESLGSQELVLPEPRRTGEVSVEEALAARRSVRAFADVPLTEAEIGQLAWAAQGVTDRGGYRTAPSAGALYPLELYVGTSSGTYRYEPARHALTLHREGDPRPAIQAAALHQEAIGDAPVVFVIAAVYERTSAKYGSRAPRYVQMEAGHAGQNILLEAVALGLAAVPIGAFHDDRLQAALSLPDDQRPLYLIPVGHPE